MLITCLDMLKTYESQGHHEMGPQTSYKQKKTTILQHFSSPESWYHSFHRFMQKLWLKNPKKVLQKKLGGPGGKAPPLAEKVA